MTSQRTATEMMRAGIPVRQDGSRRSLFEWIRFADVSREFIEGEAPIFAALNVDLQNELWEDAHYAPYLERQDAEVKALRDGERVAIPHTFDYGIIGGLSIEMRERLEKARPSTLAAANRIRGITPAAVAAILVYIRKKAA